MISAQKKCRVSRVDGARASRPYARASGSTSGASLLSRAWLRATTLSRRRFAPEIVVSVADQELALIARGKVIKRFPVSTSKFGTGDAVGSYRTPLGETFVSAKIGDGLPAGAVIKNRNATGEIVKTECARPRYDRLARDLAARDGRHDGEHARPLHLHSRHRRREAHRAAGQLRLRSHALERCDRALQSGAHRHPRPDFRETAPRFSSTRRAEPARASGLSMNKPKILFICVHNSARSQMAEAFLNDICGAEFEAQSAGLEPGTLNPLVVEVMREAGHRYFQEQDAGRLRCFQVGPAFHLRHHRLQRGGGGRLPDFPRAHPAFALAFPRPFKSGGHATRKSWRKSGRSATRFRRGSSNSARRIAPGSLNWDETYGGHNLLTSRAEREINERFRQAGRFAVCVIKGRPRVRP